MILFLRCLMAPDLSLLVRAVVQLRKVCLLLFLDLFQDFLFEYQQSYDLKFKKIKIKLNYNELSINQK